MCDSKSYKYVSYKESIFQVQWTAKTKALKDNSPGLSEEQQAWVANKVNKEWMVVKVMSDLERYYYYFFFLSVIETHKRAFSVRVCKKKTN